MVKQISQAMSIFSDSNLEVLAKIIAFVFFKMFRFKRKLVLKNLDIAFGDSLTKDQKIAIGYQSVTSFLLTEMEFLASTKGGLAERVVFQGQHHIESALSKGRGCYLLCIHMGSWEVMGSAMTRKIEKTNVVVKRVGGPKTDAYITWLRELNGFRILKRKRKGDAYIGMKQSLARNEIVGFVMDQSRPGEPRLPFFGKPARTNTSLAAIWSKCEAPIIPGYCKRTSAGQYEVTFLPEVEMQKTARRDQDHIENSLKFNKVVEQMIRVCPEQYFWLHNRWK